ncbi:MAG: toxin-activating lysine-acyltransferase [bacterium]|nr:toxin-activating lysine-acyltransferase [bacterium]
MIFGRKNKAEKVQTPAGAEPAAVAKPVAPAPAPATPTPATPQPVSQASAPTTPVAAAPVSAATPPAVTKPPAAQAATPAVASPPTAASSTPAPTAPAPQAARHPMESKMVVASFGEIVSILMRSDSHRHFSLCDLEWLVIPPVLTQQFALAEVRKGENGTTVPVGVALWASVSSEVDQKLSANMSGPLRLRPDEWKSGETLWLINATGPAQIVEQLIANLHKTVFKGRPLKVRAIDEEGKPVIKVQKINEDAA